MRMQWTLHTTRFRHFKGGIYHVLGAAQHTETGERLIVYFAAGDDANPPVVWARPESDFTGEVERAGKRVKRFTPMDGGA